jgi:hypothetical protein
VPFGDIQVVTLYTNNYVSIQKLVQHYLSNCSVTLIERWRYLCGSKQTSVTANRQYQNAI